MSKIGESEIGTYIFNKKTINKIYGLPKGTLFNTTSVQSVLPILNQKLGADVPIKIEVSYRDMKVAFYEIGNHIELEFISKVSLYAKI